MPPAGYLGAQGPDERRAGGRCRDAGQRARRAGELRAGGARRRAGAPRATASTCSVSRALARPHRGVLPAPRRDQHVRRAPAAGHPAPDLDPGRHVAAWRSAASWRSPRSGAGLWCGILTYLGWLIGRHGGEVERAIGPYVHHTLLHYVLPGTVVLVAVYVLVAPAASDGGDDARASSWRGRCRASGFAGSSPGTRAGSASPGYARNLADGRVEVVASGRRGGPGAARGAAPRPARPTRRSTAVEREDGATTRTFPRGASTSDDDRDAARPPRPRHAPADPELSEAGDHLPGHHAGAARRARCSAPWSTPWRSRSASWR